jgi:alpha-L-fucosidase
LTVRRTVQALEVDLPGTLRNSIGIALILSGSGLTDGSLAEV